MSSIESVSPDCTNAGVATTCAAAGDARASDAATASSWRLALGGAAYSASGYTAALLLVFAYFIYVQPRAGLAPVLVISYLVPLAVGLLALRAPAAAVHLGVGYRHALRRVALAEFISANLSSALTCPHG